VNRSLPAWRRVLRAAWLVAVGVGLAVALAQRRAEVADALAELTVPGVALAALAATVGVAVSGSVWRRLLAGLGAPLALRPAARVFFVGQLGKYLPGGVWPVLAQVELGRDLAVPARVSAAAAALFLWVHLVTGGAVAGVGLALAGAVPPWVGAAAAVGVVLLLAPALLARAPLPQRPPGGAVVAAVARAAVMWTAYALHLAVLVGLLGGPGDVARAAGAFAAAWCAGFLVLFAPAGAGAREAVLVALLLPVLPAGAALTAALASRLLLTVADALLAGVALLGAARR
jgi:uncharacterized membrane protein YbhN (UPF0104 family)